MSEGLQVRALYDFEAQPNSTGELTIWANEILTVTRQDVGEGWWEGMNSHGETGLFPAGYVEIVSSPPPSIPPPPLPPQDHEEEDWEDDWDDGESTVTEASEMPNAASNMSHGGLTVPSKTTVKKSFNRFSTFVKAGAESFILGQDKTAAGQGEGKVVILTQDDYVYWEPSTPYTCSISSPQKESKMRGLKSFIAYQLLPSFSTVPVSRRYKHFDWLYDRLQEKFVLIPISPLPDKQISGRYQDDFINRRRIQLQLWVSRICRHPVLSQSNVWNHFIKCNDDKNWKLGKRKAEKDQLIGASFGHSIYPPAVPLEVSKVDKELELFSKNTAKMDEAIKQLYNLCQEQCKKQITVNKRDHQRYGQLFNELSGAFDLGSSSSDQPIKEALKHTGDTFEAIGWLYEKQPKHDLEPMCDILREYKGMLSCWPEILQIQKSSMAKKKEYQKNAEEGKLNIDETTAICQRVDVIAYATLAEKNHFISESKEDFRVMMKNFLSAQRDFHQQIAIKINDTLTKYENSFS